MSAYADLDLDTPRAKSKKLKSTVAALADDARGRLEIAKERGLDLASASSARAADYARSAAGHVKRRPVSTGLIAAAAGVGLVLLFSRGARSAALSFGEDLWNRLGRR